MAKKNEELVKEVVEMTTQMSELTVDKLNETPVAEPEIQTKLTNKELADSLGVRYIEPKRKMAPFGTLPEKLKSEHQRDWEYVKGIYENIESVGESVEFWYCKYPGDPDCLWSIPANVPVFVPRMIAKHLEEHQRYHKFDYIQRPEGQWGPDEFTHEFRPAQTVYRGKFRPIEAFK